MGFAPREVYIVLSVEILLFSASLLDLSLHNVWKMETEREAGRGLEEDCKGIYIIT